MKDTVFLKKILESFHDGSKNINILEFEIDTKNVKNNLTLDGFHYLSIVNDTNLLLLKGYNSPKGMTEYIFNIKNKSIRRTPFVIKKNNISLNKNMVLKDDDFEVSKHELKCSFHMRVLKSLLYGIKEIHIPYNSMTYHDGNEYIYDDEDVQIIRNDDRDSILKFKEEMNDTESIHSKIKKDLDGEMAQFSDMDDGWESEDINEMRNDDVDDISIGQQANEYQSELKQEYDKELQKALDDDAYLDLYLVTFPSAYEDNKYLYIVLNNRVIKRIEPSKGF